MDNQIVNQIVTKPWGSYRIIFKNDLTQIKELCINPKQATSLQKHSYRDEHWTVIQGVAHIVRDSDCRIMEPNYSFFIPKGVWHRIANLGNVVLKIIEVQTGSSFDESDIVRKEDMYGRV